MFPASFGSPDGLIVLLFCKAEQIAGELWCIQERVHTNYNAQSTLSSLQTDWEGYKRENE